MPAGIVITKGGPGVDEGRPHRQRLLRGHATRKSGAGCMLEQYNALQSAPVMKKTQAARKHWNSRKHIRRVEYAGRAMRFSICLPAAQELNLNPSLLTGILEENFGVPAAEASILRTHFLTAKTLFA